MKNKGRVLASLFLTAACIIGVMVGHGLSVSGLAQAHLAVSGDAVEAAQKASTLTEGLDALARGRLILVACAAVGILSTIYAILSVWRSGD